MTVRVSVVVATHNRASLLPGILEALGSQQTPPAFEWEIVVVDNNSSDRTADIAASFCKTLTIPVRYVFEPTLGLSSARNRGIREARGDILAFTDDDVLPAPNWVDRIVEAMDRLRAHGVGGRILPRWEAAPPDWITGNPRLLRRLSIMDFDESRRLALPLERMPQVWGANMAFRREVFDRVGGFDPRFGMIGSRLFRSEESDLIERALGFGLTIAYEPTLTVYHRIGTDRMERSYFRRLEFDSAHGDARATRKVGTPALFGVPLSVYRKLLAAFGTWSILRLRRRPEAFDQELLCLGWAGTLTGYWSRNRGRPSGPIRPD